MITPANVECDPSGKRESYFSPAETLMISFFS